MQSESDQYCCYVVSSKQHPSGCPQGLSRPVQDTAGMGCSNGPLTCHVERWETLGAFESQHELRALEFAMLYWQAVSMTKCRPVVYQACSSRLTLPMHGRWGRRSLPWMLLLKQTTEQRLRSSNLNSSQGSGVSVLLTCCSAYTHVFSDAVA